MEISFFTQQVDDILSQHLGNFNLGSKVLLGRAVPSQFSGCSVPTLLVFMSYFLVIVVEASVLCDCHMSLDVKFWLNKHMLHVRHIFPKVLMAVNCCGYPLV